MTAIPFFGLRFFFYLRVLLKAGVSGKVKFYSAFSCKKGDKITSVS